MSAGRGAAKPISTRPGHCPQVARGLWEPRGHREGRTRSVFAAAEYPRRFKWHGE